VGFTDGCRTCWVENIMCDIRNCLFTCLWHTVRTYAHNARDCCPGR
jgi:hypothetical protein